jgi:MFS family permease
VTLGSYLPALRYRNFRLIWSSQLISMAGSMMQTAAILWHVSLLVPPHQRGLALGMTGAVRIVPIVVFSIVSGVVADHFDRRKVMLLTQTGMAICAAALAMLAFTGSRGLWPVYLLAALSSAFWAFDGPSRQSLIPNLVPREVLPNAISLNTIMFETAAIAGPALGGLVIAWRGVGWAYAFNALSFLFVIVALLMMRDLPVRPAGTGSGMSLQAALEGLRFVFLTPLIRATMLLDFFATFFASATALLPIFAQDVLKVGATGYGLLSAAPSVGALIAAAAMVPMAEKIRRRGLVILGWVVVYGLATVAFGLSRSFPLTFLCLAITGVADTVAMVLRNLVRQLSTPDSMRGRMMSVNMVFFMGGPQLGELEAGLMAQAFGAPLSVVTGGIGCIVAVLWTAWRTPALRAYRRETGARWDPAGPVT